MKMSLEDGNNSLLASAIAGKSSSVIKMCPPKRSVEDPQRERVKEVLKNPVEACLLKPVELVTPTPGPCRKGRVVNGHTTKASNN